MFQVKVGFLNRESLYNLMDLQYLGVSFKPVLLYLSKCDGILNSKLSRNFRCSFRSDWCFRIGKAVRKQSRCFYLHLAISPGLFSANPAPTLLIREKIDEISKNNSCLKQLSFYKTNRQIPTNGCFCCKSSTGFTWMFWK